jgi:hypothetical protein
MLTLIGTLPLFAQASTDAISGGAGWVGAGLLGGVLSWLLFIHLPAKDKQIAGLIDSRDAMVREMTLNFRAGIVDSEKRAAETDRDRRADYQASLKMVVDHCEKETALTSGAIRRDLDQLNDLAVELRKMISEVRDRNMLYTPPKSLQVDKPVS